MAGDSFALRPRRIGKMASEPDDSCRRKRFACGSCDAAFSCRSKLERHSVVHETARNFPCPRCEARFRDSRGLARHSAAVHADAKAHSCGSCGRRFSDSSNLRKHALRHTGHKYRCGACGNEYNARWTLRVHERTHDLKHDYACDKCPKTFYTNKDRNRHRATHEHPHAAPRFKCPACELTFRRKDNSERHYRNTHPSHTATTPTPNPTNTNDETRLKILEANNGRESVIFVSTPARRREETTGYFHKKVDYAMLAYPQFERVHLELETAKNQNAAPQDRSKTHKSIELYKRILCPSYDRQNETTRILTLDQI